MGGFALVRITNAGMDVALGEATDDIGNVMFTNALARRWQG